MLTLVAWTAEMVALPSRPSHLEKAFKFTNSTEPTLYYSQLKHRPHFIYIYIYPLKKLPLLFKKEKKARIFLYLFGVQHLESNHGYFTPHLFILIHSFCSSKPQSAITRIIRFSGFGFRPWIHIHFFPSMLLPLNFFQPNSTHFSFLLWSNSFFAFVFSFWIGVWNSRQER